MSYRLQLNTLNSQIYVNGDKEDDNNEEDENNRDFDWNKHYLFQSSSINNLQIHFCKRYFSFTYLLIIFLILLLICTGLIAYYYALSYYTVYNSLPPLKVNLICGEVHGLEQIDTVHYLGIPYALAPVGSNRFQLPVELSTSELCKQAWNGTIYKATKYKSACLQLKPKTNQLWGSEDCLYLNVHIPKWKPSTTGPKLLKPVIVILDGLLFLYKTQWIQPSRETLSLTQSIHVTFNYRLGPIGFLLNPATKQPNLGIYDQIAVLRWIRSNIAKFGGDPVNIILFGYGSGATCALCLLYSPIGHGLFDKLWLTGPGLISPTINVAQALDKSQALCDSQSIRAPNNTDCYKRYFENNHSLMNLWNWSVVEKWLEQELIDLPQFSIGHKSDNEHLPQFLINDGKLIDINLWHNPIHHKPIIIGQTSHELSFYSYPKTIHLLSPIQMQQYLKDKLSINSQNLTQSIYFRKKNPITQTHRICSEFSNQTKFDAEFDLMRLVTDGRFTCPLINLTNYWASIQSTNIYQYYLIGKHRLFDPYGLRAYVSHTFHGWDGMLYLRSYRNNSDFNDPSFRNYEHDKEELENTSNLLNRVMFEFAYHGNVSNWSKVKANQFKVNVIDQGRMCPQTTDYQLFEQRCEFWKLLFKNSFLIRGSWKY